VVEVWCGKKRSFKKISEGTRSVKHFFAGPVGRRRGKESQGPWASSEGVGVKCLSGRKEGEEDCDLSLRRGSKLGTARKGQRWEDQQNFRHHQGIRGRVCLRDGKEKG